MRLSFRRSLLLLLLTAFLAVTVLVPIFPDRLLQSLHPWLERVASDRLDARVSYDRLTLGRGWVAVDALRLEREGSLRVEIPRLTARWTFAGLWGRRLEAVVLEEPDVSLRLTGEPRAPLPPEPPLAIGELTVSDGRLQIEVDKRRFRLRELAVTGALAHDAPFRLAGRFGEGAGLPLQAAGTFTWGEPPAVTLEEVAWDARPLLASPLTIRLPTAGTAAEGGVQLDRFDDRQLALILAALQLPSPLPEGWSFALTAPEVTFHLVAGEVKMRLQVPAATVAGEGWVLPLQQLRGEVTGDRQGWGASAGFTLAGAPGRLQGSWAGERVEGTAVLSVIDPAAFKQLLLGGDFPPLAGGFDLAAEFARADASGEMRLQVALDGRTGRRPAQFLLDLAPLSARLELHRPVGGKLEADGSLRAGGEEILRLRGTAQRLEIELLSAAGRDLAALLPPEQRPAFAAGLEGVAGGATLLRGAEGEWSGAGRLQVRTMPVAGGLLRDAAVNGDLHVRGTEVGLQHLRFSGAWEGEGAAARISGAGNAVWRGGELRLQLQQLALAELDYLAADGLTGLTGGRLEAVGTVAGTPGKGLRLDLTADLGAREILHGPFYADLSLLPARLALRGRLTGDNRLEAETLSITIPGLGAATLHGTLGGERLELDGRAAIPDFAGLFAGPIGQALVALRPGLADLRPAGGAVIEGVVRRQESWQGSGELQLAGVSLDWPSVRLNARQIGGRIPWFIDGSGISPEEESRRGRIDFAELRLGPAALTRRPLLLVLSPERFAIETPLHFALAGGELQIEEAALAWGEAPEMAARLVLRQVDLSELTRQLELPAMTGRISANLGRIRYRGGSLSADGSLGINAFGGDILVRNLRLESIFSRYRTLQADVDFTGIDLSELTRTFEFGEINGIADGHVHGLRLFGAIPSAFDARLETRDSGRRNLSVKALHNISVLSQGGFSAVLSRGIYRFVDFYRYRKIGILCSLKNDVFSLQGTARPGTDDYLVYGGLLPPKINIIAPARTVSFKEMLKRLQRIDRSDHPPPDATKTTAPR